MSEYGDEVEELKFSKGTGNHTIEPCKTLLVSLVYVCVRVREERPSSFYFFRFSKAQMFHNCRSRLSCSFCR